MITDQNLSSSQYNRLLISITRNRVINKVLTQIDLELRVTCFSRGSQYATSITKHHSSASVPSTGHLNKTGDNQSV